MRGTRESRHSGSGRDGRRGSFLNAFLRRKIKGHIFLRELGAMQALSFGFCVVERYQKSSVSDQVIEFMLMAATSLIRTYVHRANSVANLRVSQPQSGSLFSSGDCMYFSTLVASQVALYRVCNEF